MRLCRIPVAAVHAACSQILPRNPWFSISANPRRRKYILQTLSQRSVRSSRISESTSSIDIAPWFNEFQARSVQEPRCPVPRPDSLAHCVLPAQRLDRRRSQDSRVVSRSYQSAGELGSRTAVR
ncbi:hypothetical protein X777_14497 [Ooceraea biroi]|uniref:Uncharacterized protein n=1 Tax=Ooceraea biroi TaxID=2015173 RepID=A0A026VWM2_OOCBI|nr:hypothetical protein X777_14497 [Ooceraea biroi]